MSLSINHDRLAAAYRRVRQDLLAERGDCSHWTGRLSSSALSTATAISALSLVQRNTSATPAGDQNSSAPHASRAPSHHARFDHLIARGLRWLADQQNDDGGWGDTDKSHSNISTTMLVRAAFHLTAVPAEHDQVLQRAEAYCRKQGGTRAIVRRYGKDKTFAVPILANSALAGLASWREVSPLPFELSCLPQSTFRFLRLPVVSYALPALIAIGQLRFAYKKPINPLLRSIRTAAVPKSLRVLEAIQPSSGGFLEATPLTSFVVMSLAATGRADHPVVRRGVEFLVRSVRPDGSWPIDTDLATWTTSLSVTALASSSEGPPPSDVLPWLLDCQHRQVHPFTGAAPGGWGWSDLPGAVPDADDTPAALLALDALYDHQSAALQQRIVRAAEQGVGWLIGLQNRDGGWPTFCRGWGRLPFDRSGTDLTAHALRALTRWQKRYAAARDAGTWSTDMPHSARDEMFGRQIQRAIRRGFSFLAARQRPDGSWLPLWFGNQANPDDENPVYGTARVLLAYRDTGGIGTRWAQRGIAWLVGHQSPDGGWGGQPVATTRPKGPETRAGTAWKSTVEETAVAVEALLAASNHDPAARAASQRGLLWLIEAVESGRHRETAPIGFYFAKLWYYEKLYPLIFCTSALGHAMVAEENGHSQQADSQQAEVVRPSA